MADRTNEAVESDESGDQGDAAAADAGRRFADEVYGQIFTPRDNATDRGLGSLSFNTRALYRDSGTDQGNESDKDDPRSEVDADKSKELITAGDGDYKLVRGRDGKYEVRDKDGKRLKGEDLQTAQDAMEREHGLKFDKNGKVEGRIYGKNSDGEVVYRGPEERDVGDGQSAKIVDGKVTELRAGDYTASRDGNGKWKILDADGKPVTGDALKEAQKQFADELGFDFKFDRQGRIQGNFEVDDKGQIKYSYKDGLFDVSQYRGTDGNVERDLTRTFKDASGKERTVGYNEKGEVNGVVIKGPDGKVERALEFERGEDGKVERVTSTNSKGEYVEYTKDADGNWNPPGLKQDLGFGEGDLNGDLQVDVRGNVGVAGDSVDYYQNEDGTAYSIDRDSYERREFDKDGNEVPGSERYWDGYGWREPERDEDGNVKKETGEDGNEYTVLKPTGRQGEAVKIGRNTDGGNDQFVMIDSSGKKIVADWTKGNGEITTYNQDGSVEKTQLYVGNEVVDVTKVDGEDGEYFKVAGTGENGIPEMRITYDGDGNTVVTEGNQIRVINKDGKVIETRTADE